MSLNTLEYLSLSAIAYLDFDKSLEGATIEELISRKAVTEKDLNKPELSVLKDPSSPLRSYTLVYFEKDDVSGFAGVAFRSPSGKIILAFRGTELDRGFLPALSDIATDTQIGSMVLSPLAQFWDTLEFAQSVVARVTGNDNISKKDALKYLRYNNATATGHSLGGGLASYLTYRTSDFSSGSHYGGIQAITFNAVGIGTNLLDVSALARLKEYNITDHVNSLDWVGMYGVPIGSTIQHIDTSDLDYKRVNFNALGKMLAIRLRLSKGNIDMLEYKRQINNIKNTIAGGPGRYSVTDTMAVYSGYEGVGGNDGSGLFNTSRHNLDRFLCDDPSKPGLQYKMTETVADQKLSVRNLRDLFNLINAFQVIERAKIDKNYTTDVISRPPLQTTMSQGGITYYNNLVTLPDGSISSHPYNHDQIAYANYVVQQFERRLASGDFMSAYVDTQKAQADQDRRVDPLVFDLDGDGITTISIDESNTFFDLDNSGFAERTSWIGSGEGLLAYDRNGDGIINGGNELFGDRILMKDGKTLASSGFAALAEYDDNKDGKIDSNDAIYTLLRIWQDSDGDGITSAGELKQLVELGIVSIGLSYSNTGVTDSANNVQVRTGTFTLADGSSRLTGEYLLNRDPLQSIEPSLVSVSDDVALLPNVQGAGNVGSLHKAIMKDESGSLHDLVKEFVQEKNSIKREALTRKILVHWAGVGSVDPKSRGSAFDAQKLAVLEKFFGTEFRGSPNTNAALLLQKSYDKLFEVVYVSLVSQVQLKDIMASIKVESDVVSFKDTFKVLDATIFQDAKAGIDLLSEFARVMKYHGLKKSVEFENLRNYYVKQSAEYGRIIDFAGEKVLNGTDKGDSLNTKDDYTLIAAGDGDDGLYADNNDNVLYGDAGNDTIYGMGGDDVLVGGVGNDQLRGGAGDDIYRFSRGDGTDYIEETDGFDTIQLGEGILPEDVILQTVSGYGNKISLAITIKNTTDKIVVDGHFGTRIYNSDRLHADNPGSQIERITFSNGASWDIDEIYRRAHDMVGTENADYLASFEDGAYTYHGLGGNDSIVGGSANDFLYGDDGNDTIYGHGGNDVLSGGAGDDQLRGGTGDDVYLFSRGDGVDYIEETDGFDTIQFGEGISPNDVVARVVSTEEKSISLELSIVGTKDKIAVNYHFGRYSYYQQEDIASPGNQIERVMFADGTAWDLDEIYRRAHDMVGTDGNDNFSMVGNAPVIYHGLAGNDNISGRSGKDVLYGDAGDDYISGGGTLIGGPGNDNIRGSKGDDIYIFNRGDGQDLITDTGGMDTIRFGDGIRPDDIVIKRVGNGYGHNLELCIKDTDDKVAVYEHFGTNSYWGSVDNPAAQIERVEFADGTVWTKEDIDDKMHNRTGTDGSDILEAYGKRGVVYHGLGGDDNLRGATGDDQLYGEDGDDRISGGEGNDLIVGGRGNDIIDSFRGDDTYVFNRGDGKDVITDYNGFDTVYFGEGIKPEDIVLKRVYVNRDWSLVMSIRGTEDAVTFISHFDPVKSYLTANYTLEQITFADGTVWTKDDIDYKMHHLTGTEENDQLAAYDKADVVYYGRGGDDNLRGGAGNDQLYGEDGDDQLYGDEGNDLIVGGKGNDTISSFRGDDVYVFNRGDGKDIITDYNGFDTIQLGEGIKPEDVVLKRVYVNRDWSLEISLKDTDDAITFISHFDPTKPSMSSNHTLEQIKFADGTVWTKEDIDDKMHHLTGTEDDDRLAAYDKARVVYHGRGGNDTLVGSEGNDELYGEDGDDRISSGGGNDLIAGGRGNDIIDSFRGDDIYVFNRGDGQDTINDYDGTDAICFGEGVRPEDITISRVPWYSNYNLVLSFKDTDDKITVVSHFGSSNYSGYYATPQRRIERFEFADGTVWTAETVDEKMHNLVGTDAKDDLIAYDDKPVTYYGMGGNDTLRGRQGNDVLVGGTDDDYLIGDAGDDTYVFSRGDGKDRVFDTGGNDTIRLGYNHAEVMFKKIYSSDLLLEMCGSADSVQIQEWYNYNSDRRIETIQAEDGYTIQPEKVQQLIQAMASFGNSHGMTWQQALEAHSAEAQSIISQYWTAPTA